MFLGALISGGMIVIMLWTRNVIANTHRYDSTHKWNASPEETTAMFAVLGLVTAFGVSAAVAGFWHLLTGKRNLKLLWIMLGLGFVLYIAAIAVPEIFN